MVFVRILDNYPAVRAELSIPDGACAGTPGSRYVSSRTYLERDTRSQAGGEKRGTAQRKRWWLSCP